MTRVFIGYDPRQPLAFSVLSHSIARHATKPVQITPLILAQLPIKRRGLTEFTFSRFLCPWLCEFKGTSIFLDADMAVRGDIHELAAAADPMAPVSVVQDQPQFEWPSVMVFQNYLCRTLTPEHIDDQANKLFDFAFAEKAGTRSVGNLPREWNVCLGYTDDVPQDAKLYHWTQGIPCWPETRGLEQDDVWHEEFRAATHTVSWMELMGKSVHFDAVMRRHLAKYGLEAAC